MTGGAGFIGSHLLERLLARGDRVVVIDDLSTGRVENLHAADPHGRARFVRADLRSALADLRGERFDEVYHLAAAVGVGLVMDRPAEAIETNVELTSMLLRFASGLPLAGGGRIEADASAGPVVVIASSSEVYGKAGSEVFSENDDVVYGPTSVVRWSYAYAKALDEHLAMAFARQAKLRTVGVRFFNTVGPRQVGRYGMVLPRFVGAALRHEPLRVYGDGSQSRCFCDVRDVARALPELAACPGAWGGVVNLGRDDPITIRALAERVIATLASPSAIEFVPYSEVYPPGFEDLARRRPDTARLNRLIRFQPIIPLADTIGDLARWMQAARSSIGPS